MGDPPLMDTSMYQHGPELGSSKATVLHRSDTTFLQKSIYVNIQSSSLSYWWTILTFRCYFGVCFFRQPLSSVAPFPRDHLGDLGDAMFSQANAQQFHLGQWISVVLDNGDIDLT